MRLIAVAAVGGGFQQLSDRYKQVLQGLLLFDCVVHPFGSCSRVRATVRNNVGAATGGSIGLMGANNTLAGPAWRVSCSCGGVSSSSSSSSSGCNESSRKISSRSPPGGRASCTRSIGSSTSGSPSISSTGRTWRSVSSSSMGAGIASTSSCAPCCP